ncbi:MAG TPA: hypothetical protein PK349_05965 [Candidatus Hydrogenedentes bacterium]|nr:hypothetical protein [Candidatus Hydrogenedentota bacterium]
MDNRVVLVGTDDARLAEQILAAARAIGLEGEWGADGVDILELAERNTPLVVFLDVSLGGLSARECCESLRNTVYFPRDCPVYLLTDDPVPAEKLEKMGFYDTWPKQRESNALRELLAKLMWK